MIPDSEDVLRLFKLEEVLRNDKSQLNLLGTINDSKCVIKTLILYPIPLKTNPIHFDLHASGLWKKLSLELKSESGAEYHFYDANVSLITLVLSRKRLSYGVEVIWPANNRQINMARPMVKHVVEETPLIYEEIVLPIIEKQIGDGSGLSWIDNILSGEKEKERLLVSNPDSESGYIINVDTKWRSHPDCHSPRDEWHKTDVTDLYCLGIVRCKGIKCLRDLRQHHVPMLRGMLNDGMQIIKQVYGLEAEKMRIFIHYHPTVHFVHLKNDIGVSPEKCHLLTDVIQNLELDGSCYVKRTFKVWLPENAKMYKAIKGDK